MAEQETRARAGKEGETGAASMSGGTGGRPDTGGSSQAPGGRRDGAAGADLSHPGAGTATGDMPASGSGGSYATGTYDDRGNLTGPDTGAAGARPGEGQGDDLVNRLGGGEGGGAGLSGGGSVTGDLDPSSSGGDEERPLGAGIGTDAGAPGGMGGAGVTGSGRPPGGSTPVDRDRQD